MGRGYSNSRSRSARPTLRMKRQRSVSMHQLRDSLQSANTITGVRKTKSRGPVSSANTNATAIVKKGVNEKKVETKRTPTTERQSSSSRVRSASTIRQKIAIMESELENNMEPEENIAETIVKPDVMTKYKSAGRALDEVMNLVAAACVPGANTKQLCDLGDEELLQRVRGMFSKAKDADGKRILRGLSYPMNISVNHTLCNHAPVSEEEAVILRGGDVVKIHVGCHIDGYPVTAARTIVVPHDTNVKSTSSTSLNNTEAEATDNNNDEKNTKMRVLSQGASNAIEAARVALQGMIHLMQPGMLNADITDFIHRVGNHFEVQALEGVLSNRTKRWVPDGMDCIITRRVTLEDPHQDVAECTVGSNQVWTLDVAFTDHSIYKVMPVDGTTTIFRRTEVDFQNDARVRSVHASLQEITEKHQCFPFSLNHVDNPLKTRMAVAMLRKQNVIDPLPVMRIKGEHHITARFSATVSVSDKRVTVLCGLPPETPIIVDDDVRPPAVSEDIAEVLATPLVFPKEGQPERKKMRTEEPNKTTTTTTTAVADVANEEEE
ncbi:proliferation-associated 2g4 [Trypanosoma theileri]|uniref:Proliferation-associated 2g4 n=1 Tax=Trypanosoma theileri TaxID=67003 RepID=A0A1X0NPS8_9TRYP|nr:proliferation-associated 2g4 [Trypanosoma theileri]ORC86140.1 proliferation-associated 2g4 [Trypanosoma theileri]